MLLPLQMLVAQEKLEGTDLLDQYIENKQVGEAAIALQQIIDAHKRNDALDSLHYYPYYVAKIERLKGNLPEALRKMKAFTDDLEKQSVSQKSLYLAKVSMSEFYDEVGENPKSLDITKQALQHVLDAQDVTLEEIGKIRYNLGVCYMTEDDIPGAKKQFQEALIDYETYPETTKKALSDGYNAMGAIMWLSTKLDSATYFYKKAAESIEQAQGDSLENLHYATVIKSNVSLLEYSQGNMNKALEIQNNVIRDYEKVIQGVSDPEMKSRTQRFQARAISNLATFYNEVGNLSRANELVRYAYLKQQKFLEPTDDGIAGSLIQIGQSELALKSYEKATEALHKGLKIYEEKNAVRPYWKAAAYHALATAYQEQGQSDSAAYYYNIALPSFNTALGENIDTEYLNFLSNKAQFESSQGNETAVLVAQKAYDYVAAQSGNDSFEVVKQMVNLAQVHSNLKQYDQAARWSAKGDSLLQKRALLSENTVDAIRIEFNRPLLLLVKAQAAFYNLDEISEQTLLPILQELSQAVSILERRKEIVVTPEDTEQLLSEYKQINDFSKQVQLELYQKTENTAYLSALVTAQESGVYSRIRAKLNTQNTIAFLGIPEAVLNEEKTKKEALSQSLLEDESGVLTYYNKEKDWRSFLDSLKRDYPEYYKMRYETIEIPIDQIVNQIPEEVTVIRYFFVKNKLYAFLANTGSQQLVALDKVEYQALDYAITRIMDNQFEKDIFLEDVHQLYKQIWEPLLGLELKENLIIIPDGPLYNLSFEMLTTSRIEEYSAFSKKSLLAQHNISYNYSLLLSNIDNRKIVDDNFIAFTPEFSQLMKDEYRIAIKDSLDIDQTYLTLLPQPFSVSIAEDYTRVFNGDHFKNVNATKQFFMKNAGEHKIIHIGTHAESNNISPELSRLIFAKPISEKQSLEDNSLYTYEIYNCNLSSNLAILTACETGKPGYQSGEGMISLAHAFNYAGSESILTSLWKIDEQSSAQIVSYFYDNLKKGMRKDRALKEAKLQYLSTAGGRTLQPNYWAGLVLMGDASPLELENGWSWWVWILIIVIGLIVIGTLSRKRNH
jgi:CHAT domain-containing protein/Tfp pilus assembly protein PilF